MREQKYEEKQQQIAYLWAYFFYGTEVPSFSKTQCSLEAKISFQLYCQNINR
jgi:hypothetical protein